MGMNSQPPPPLAGVSTPPIKPWILQLAYYCILWPPEATPHTRGNSTGVEVGPTLTSRPPPQTSAMRPVP